MAGDEIKSNGLSFIAHHAPLFSISRWDISAGQLFELMMPASFALTALLSAWVLASARRQRFGPSAVTFWTLCTLFFPFITLPLYLVVRSYSRYKERRGPVAEDSETVAVGSEQPSVPMRRALPLIYLTVMLSVGALYFYTESRRVDAHLARANQARVRNQREQIIEEYRRALALEDNAHTRNLLGRELLAARRWEEALAEFREAERAGEPDDLLPFNMAEALDNLKRHGEAKHEYERFVSGPLCRAAPPDVRCKFAEARLKVIRAAE